MRRFVPVVLLFLAGCASRPGAIPVIDVPPPPPMVVRAPLPPGATPGMRIPAAMPDGSYPTPNQRLTTAAAVWHLRAGLNVAALSCPGVQGNGIIAAYTALLKREKTGLAAAEKRYSEEFRAGGGDWQDRYDDAMTRLYNFFAQVPARTSLCSAAERSLAAAAAVPPGGLDAFAPAQVAALDQPFADFYRAYDAWRRGALVASAGPPPRAGLQLDPAVFGKPEAQ